MSWQASAWAKRVKTGSPAVKAVLLCLADYADEEHSCYPGQERLAAETEQSVRTVRRHVETLEDLGVISRTKRYGASGQRTSDRYVLAVDDPRVAMVDLPAILTGGQDDLRSTETPDQATTGQPEQPLPDTGVRGTTSGTTSSTTGTNQGSTRGTRLPEDWEPDEALKQWFREQPFAHTVNPVIETTKFVNYWTAKTGKDATKLDWRKTWMNWMLSASQRTGRTPAPSQTQHDPELAERHRRIFEGSTS